MLVPTMFQESRSMNAEKQQSPAAKLHPL